ncbi:hypothetical protein EsH8_III_000169 [Colletotrichum jinshuiense]
MASSTPYILIRPATEADTEAIAKVHYAALAKFHDFYAAFFERHPREILPISTRNALRDSSNRFLVAVSSETDAVLGFIKYIIVNSTESPTTTPIIQSSDATEVQPNAPSVFAIKSHMKELWESFSHPREDEMDECYEKAVNGRKHNYVKNIMVDPEHQRKGIGAKLLQTVIDISNAENMPTFLVASAEGHGLYKKLGFEDLGTWIIDNDHWSKEIVRHEKQLGIAGNERLIDQYDGTQEVERYMMRWVEEQ